MKSTPLLPNLQRAAERLPLRELAHGLGPSDSAPGGAGAGSLQASRCPLRALAAVFRLPQDRRALAEALSKESQASLTLAQALFDEPSVQCELAEVAPEDTLTGARP
jgi:hypothetical protein